MATSNQIITYLGATQVKVGVIVMADTLIALGAEVIISKTSKAMASVNGTDFFPIGYNEVCALQAGASYIFSQDVMIAYGKVFSHL